MGNPVDTGEAFFVLPQLTVRFVDDCGDALREIYVLYRVAPPPEEPEDDSLLGYLGRLVYGEEEKPPPPRFEIAVTDEVGYLVPIESVGPGPGECVESIKLTADIAYELYLIRHPDPELAKAAQRELNACLGKARDGALTKTWPDPTQRTPTVECVGPSSEDQLTISIANDAGNFLPPGPARYGGWTLYKDMPHAQLQAVKDATKTLQLDLGKLRYVVGAYPPYEPEALDKKQTNKASANEGVFDSRTMSAVLHLQRQSLAGDCGDQNAFQVSDKSAAHDKAAGKTAIAASHAYLKGQPTTVPSPAPRAGERALKADGVVDSITARAIETWIDRGCRRPGPILVGTCARCPHPVDYWDVWLRDEAFDALEAWRDVTMAFGFPEGIAANHTYRTPLQDVGKASYGRSAVSIHKTGLAIDVGVQTGFLTSVKDWPVVFVRDELVAKTSKGVVYGHRAYWRLFARSELPAELEAAAATLGAKLQEQSGEPGMTGTVATALHAELQADAAAFFAKYFRDAVAQWTYDPYDDEGGSPGVSQTPAARFGDPKYTRWIDITALGELCSLKRIGSFTNKLEPTGSDWGLAAGKVKPSKVGNLELLAQKLVAAKAEVEDPIELSFDAKKVPLAELRADELLAYAEALPNFYTDKALKRFSKVEGSRLTITLSWSASGREAVEAAASALEAIEIPLVAAEVDATPRTGADWAAWLRERVEALASAAPAQQTDGSSSATTKPPQRLTLYPIIADTSDGAHARVLNTETIYYPAPGSPIGMEWWHFQRSDLVSKVRRFGSLLLELGWTEEGLLDTQSAATYWRTGVGYPMSELDKTVG